MAHSHSHEARKDGRKQLKIAWVLTLVLFVAELFGGFKSNSLALLSDAGHMLGDLIALSLSLLSIFWAAKQADTSKTYGYYRAEVLAALVNGVLLLYVALQIVIEAFHRFSSPETIQVEVMLPIAIAGLLVNVICAFLLHGHTENLVTRSAFYHVISDLFSSVCVIVAGFVVYFTNWKWIDAPVSVLIAILIVRNALHLLKEVYDILMEASPPGVELDQVRKAMLAVSGVSEIHDLHIWSIGSGFSAASAHLLVPNMDLKKAEEIIKNVNRVLREQFKIEHTTLQLAAQTEPAKIQNIRSL